MNSNNYLLEKQAIVETMGWTALGHLGQNAYVQNSLMNEDGGERLAKSTISNKISGNVHDGMLNTLKPESGVIGDHLQHYVEKIPNMNNTDRTLLYHGAQGNFTRLQKSKAARSNPVLNDYLRNKLKLPDHIIDNMFNDPTYASYMEDLHKRNGLGKMSIGASNYLKDKELSEIVPVAEKNKNIGRVAETVTNFGIGHIEPGMAALNYVKRAATDKTPPKLSNFKPIAKVQTGINNAAQEVGTTFEDIGKNMVYNSAKKAANEIPIGNEKIPSLLKHPIEAVKGAYRRTKLEAARYGANPVTVAASEYVHGAHKGLLETAEQKGGEFARIIAANKLNDQLDAHKPEAKSKLFKALGKTKSFVKNIIR